ncbi:MAG: hypothetical protein AAGF24_16235 [Cyanobacteria bacterium P01_H01_bin.121]
MYIIEIALKFTPVPLSVQRKELEDAEKVYTQVLDAIKSAKPNILELTCEHQPSKKIAMITSEVASIQVYEKSGSAMTNKRPGFFAG